MNIDDSLHQSTRNFSTLEKNPLPFSGTNHDYWMNSNHVEILATKIQNISPQNQYTILETEDDSGETIAHGTSPGYGGNTSGGGTGSYPGGNNTGGQGQDPNRGNDGGEESAPIEVRGIRARPDADGQLAIVDDQNNFVREAHYNGPAGSRNYDITVDSTVLDAQKTYSDIEDQQATDQQITDFLKDVAAGQTYSDIRSTVINSPDMKSVMNSYEQQLYGVAPDQNTQDWLKTNLQNGRTIQDVRWEDAHSQRMTDAIFSMINGVQDRNDASDAYDANYKNITMDALGRKEISFFQNRNNLIDSSGENGVIDDYEQQLYGTNAGQNDQNWVRNNLHNGRTMQDIRWEDSHSQRMTDSIVGLYSSLANYTPYNDQISSWQNTFANGQGNYNSAHSIIAHGSEATAALTTAMQMVTGQQPSNSAALQPYQDAMANGGSLNDAIYKFAHSDQAKIASNIFIAANIGPATVSLINASEAMLTNIAQAYQSMKNYSESQIQSTANGYHAAFRAGDALNSVMPNTWEGWLGLTATIVIFMTPPGEAVAIAEVAAIGGEELLSLALDTETNIALDSLYATGTSDLVTTVSQSEIDILAQFTPRQSGATLDLGNGVIVTQTEGNLKKAGALIFKGGNFDAVSSYFKTLTGYSGDLEAIKNNTSTIPEGAAIYKIKTNLGYVSMRNITSSIGDFTIEFTNRLNNGIKEIKFLF